MNGDSADPIIADAYAFGVRGFDAEAALTAMVKGATESEPLHGLETERQDLDQYLAQHYVDAGALDIDSIDYSMGGSVTLEYAIDDFSIAQFAADLGNQSVYSSMMGRAHNWEYLFDPTTGLCRGTQRRRELSARRGLPDVAVRGRRGGRVRGGQRHPVHLVRPPGSRRPGKPHGWGR
jgi:putative alpha-1,2-mannosidase